MLAARAAFPTACQLPSYVVSPKLDCDAQLWLDCQHPRLTRLLLPLPLRLAQDDEGDEACVAEPSYADGEGQAPGVGQPFVRSLFHRPAPVSSKGQPGSGKTRGGARSRSPSPEPSAAEAERARLLEEELAKVQQVRKGQGKGRSLRMRVGSGRSAGDSVR